MSTSTVSPVDSHPDQQSKPTFYVVSVRKMAIMTICTFGLYLTYWNYRNWAAYKRASGDEVIPFLRALFSIFFLYALLQRVDRAFQASGRTYRWSPGLLVLGVVGVFLIAMSINFATLDTQLMLTESPEGQGRFLLLAYLLSLLQFACHVWLHGKMQRAMNTHEHDTPGQTNARLTWANWAWMAPGILIWWLELLAVIRGF
ncbi:MAG: hypothetical protein LBJ37_10465 [Paucimonas sp.]|jgi:hypothetical protein|nr:hypothetical protein [Paucimonas sp.]